MQWVYIDTSMLVKRYIFESGTQELQRRLIAEQPSLISSELVKVEIISALRRRQRQGTIDEAMRHRAHSRFLQDLTTPLLLLERLDSNIVQKAAHLLNDLALPLATLDALHLATALIKKVDIFFTTDKQLSRAAKEASLAVWPEFD